MKKYIPKNNVEEDQLNILSDILDISVEELSPEDKLNYHVPLLYVLEAMDIYKNQNSQP